MKALAVVCLIGAINIAVLTGIVINSLPTWCANPDVGGNWIVQPFCKGE